MNIFIAGGSGAIGRVLVPLLVAGGHRVVAMTRSQDRADQLTDLGAEAVIGDVYDRTQLTESVVRAEPDVVIHQLTAFNATDANPLEETKRLRILGTKNLVEAASAAGARRFIAQSISFICKPVNSGLTNEETPLYLDSAEGIRSLAHAVSELERQTLSATSMAGVVLRYGRFYGLGTDYDPSGSIPIAIRKGKMALVGDGAGVYSFIGLRDAASATIKALSRGEGIYNIVDDQPVALKEWLPIAAQLLRAPDPTHMDEAVARAKFGDLFVYTMNEQSGASNAKAKRELDWRPSESWREGFTELYSLK